MICYMGHDRYASYFYAARALGGSQHCVVLVLAFDGTSLTLSAGSHNAKQVECASGLIGM